MSTWYLVYNYSIVPLRLLGSRRVDVLEAAAFRTLPGDVMPRYDSKQ